MGYHRVELHIFVQLKKEEIKTFFEKMITSLLKKSVRFDDVFPPKGYTSYKDLPSLDPLLEHITNPYSGGTAYFIYKGIHFYFVYEEVKGFGDIVLTCDIANLRRSHANIKSYASLCKLLLEVFPIQGFYGFADFQSFADSALERVQKEGFDNPMLPWNWITFYSNAAWKKIDTKKIIEDKKLVVERIKCGFLVMKKKIPEHIWEGG